AMADGLVSLHSGLVHVDLVLKVDGDVDYETGNIDFKGTVVIQGGVKSGFKVKAVSDITVKTVVEDAELESEGSIELKGGFVGSGKGKMNAKENVTLSFAENQNIYAGGDARVSDALLHSTVEADGKISVSGKKGIVGGTVTAGESIETQSAGSDAFTRTVLRIGLKRAVREKMEQYKEDVQNNKANMIKIDSSIARFEKLRKIKKELQDSEKTQYAKILTLKKTLLKEKETLESIKKEIDEEYTKFESASIRVKSKVYPGVVIDIGGAKMTINEAIVNVVFKRKGDSISILRQKK
ncbi:FapA family protein, partial [candidate division KSB1 bacterium]